ncbi:DHH family phosphoesterase [Candidatus Saccharibacteria bacterium]|nr:DHH family phosphoesterase [Candidatus Saccharibacteria bacterium]
MEYPEANQVKELVEAAQHVVVLQADNPDADSLGSALALEQLLGELGKEVSLYCAVDMPSYLRYLGGWDRVQKDLPTSFDIAIIVDASTLSLFERLSESGNLGWIKSRPLIVLDHHALVQNGIDFSAVTICDDTISSTGELIFQLAQQLGWQVDSAAGQYIMAAILGDTQGLSNALAKISTYETMVQLLKLGVDRSNLEELRRQASKMPVEIFKYKSRLMERTEFLHDGQIATVLVPQNEINDFSPIYNPAALVQFDMLQVDSVKLSIVFKQYDNGRITAAIRANYNSPVAGQLAEKMGGGGHEYASGFKLTNGKPFNEVKSECLSYASELIDNLTHESQT